MPYRGRFRRVVLVVLAILSVVSTPAPSAIGASLPPPMPPLGAVPWDDLFADFVAVATRAELWLGGDGAGRPAPHVRKFAAFRIPVPVVADPGVVVPDLGPFLAALGTVTRRRFLPQRVGAARLGPWFDATAPPAVVVALLDPAFAGEGAEPAALTEARRFLTRVPCFFRARSGRDAAIRAALVAVRADLPPARRTECLHEEFTQALGLAADVADPRRSLHHDGGPVHRFAWYDCLMLALLYDPAVRPGDGPRDLEARRETLLARLRARLADRPDLCAAARFSLSAHP